MLFFCVSIIEIRNRICNIIATLRVVRLSVSFVDGWTFKANIHGIVIFHETNNYRLSIYIN